MESKIRYPHGVYRDYDLVRIPCSFLLNHCYEHELKRPDIFKFIITHREMLEELGETPIVPTEKPYDKCGKIFYRTEKLALFALDVIQKDRGYRGKNKPCRHYVCNNCKMYHLTSSKSH